MSEFILRIFDVEHGQCALMVPPLRNRLAMIDSGHNATTGWRPSDYIRDVLRWPTVDYLFLTNADQDHISDLARVVERGINIDVLYRNRTIDGAYLRRLKSLSGPVSDDMERYLALDAVYTNTGGLIDFDQGMGGVTVRTFCNSWPAFTDTNDLSLATFVSYGTFKILFPGDLEVASWQELLKNPAFRAELAATNILVASHHGRWNGYCEDVFKICTPQAIVVSDKAIVHDTQGFPHYQYCVAPDGIIVIGHDRRRHVLTTRRDGDIIFRVAADGTYWVETTKGHTRRVGLLNAG